MNEGERHRHILGFLRDRPFATVRDLSQIVRRLARHHPPRHRQAARSGRGPQSVRRHRRRRQRHRPDRLAARPFEENQMLGVEAKKAIAEEAEKLVNDGDALIIHGGSTCYLFALRLARRNVKIYTNSMPLASTLWQNGTCHLTLAGGELHRDPGILYSPVVESPSSTPRNSSSARRASARTA